MGCLRGGRRHPCSEAGIGPDRVRNPRSETLQHASKIPRAHPAYYATLTEKRNTQILQKFFSLSPLSDLSLAGDHREPDRKARSSWARLTSQPESRGGVKMVNRLRVLTEVVIRSQVAPFFAILRGKIEPTLLVALSLVAFSPSVARAS